MPTDKKAQPQNLIWKKISDNLSSIILGLLVVAVGVSVVVRLINQPSRTDQLKKEETAKIEEQKLAGQTNYKVKKGDHLWKIAEEHFGSGFNAYDIAKASNIKNPDYIEVGQELIIPDVEARQPTTGVIAEAKTAQVTLKGDTYKVVQGDYLWSIALRAYGDGYQWVKIAKANNLANPDLIHPGDVLTLPR